MVDKSIKNFILKKYIYCFDIFFLKIVIIQLVLLIGFYNLKKYLIIINIFKS